MSWGYLGQKYLNTYETLKPLQLAKSLFPVLQMRRYALILRITSSKLRNHKCLHFSQEIQMYGSRRQSFPGALLGP